MIEYALCKIVTSNSDFEGLAGSRLYPVLLPQNATLPAATYQVIATKALYTLEDRVDLTEIVLQFSIFARSYPSMKQLMAAINSSIDNFSGTIDTIRIFGVQLDSASDRYEDAARIFYGSADYRIQFAS